MHAGGENVTAMLKNLSMPILYQNMQSREAPRDCKLVTLGYRWRPCR